MRALTLPGLALALVATILCSAPAHAIVSQGIGIMPVTAIENPTPQQRAYFYFNGAPGSVQNGSFVVSNQTADTRTISVTAVDATTTSDGTFAMLSSTGALTGAGGWIRMPVSTVTLKPQASQKIPVTFSIPRNASVGDHLAGIVAQDLGKTAEALASNQSNVKIVTRVGLRVYASVQGQAAPNIAIASFKTTTTNDDVTFWTELHNDGNTINAPASKITLTDWGREISTMDGNNDITLAPDAWYKGSVTKAVHPLFIGRYVATLAVTHNGQSITKSTSFTVINWLNILWLTLGLLFIVFRVWRTRWFRRLHLLRLIFGTNGRELNSGRRSKK